MPKSSGLPMQYRIAEMQEKERTRRQREAIPQQLLMGLGQTILNMGSTLGVDAVKYFGLGGKEREEVALDLGRAQTDVQKSAAEQSREQTSLMRPQFEENVRAQKRAEAMSGAALQAHLPEDVTLETASNAEIGLAFKKLDALLGRGGRGWQAAGTQVGAKPKVTRRGGGGGGQGRKFWENRYKILKSMDNNNLLSTGRGPGAITFGNVNGRTAALNEAAIMLKNLPRKKKSKSIEQLNIDAGRIKAGQGRDLTEDTSLSGFFESFNAGTGASIPAPPDNATSTAGNNAATVFSIENAFRPDVVNIENGVLKIKGPNNKENSYTDTSEAVRALGMHTPKVGGAPRINPEALLDAHVSIALQEISETKDPAEKKRLEEKLNTNLTNAVLGMKANRRIFGAGEEEEGRYMAPLGKLK